MTRILAVLCQNPFRYFDGGTYVVRASLRKLAEKGEVFVTGFGADFRESEVGGYPSAGFLGETSNSRAHFLLALAAGRAYSVEKYASAAAQKRFVQIIGRQPYTVIWCEKLLASAVVYQSRKMWHGPGAARCVLRAHNIEHLLIDERFEGGNPVLRLILHQEAERLKKYETDILEFMDQTFAISRGDLGSFLALRPDLAGRIQYLPVPVEVRGNSTAERFREPTTVLFVGNCRWRPNLVAARWIVEELAPELERQLPQICVRLVGSGAVFRDAGPNVEAMGFVEDLESEYARALCTVAPIRTGGGLNVKVLESLAHGVPVVGTAFARRGIDTEAILEAESAAGFVAGIRKLMQDPAEYQQASQTARKSMTLTDRLFDEAWNRLCVRLAI